MSDLNDYSPHRIDAFPSVPDTILTREQWIEIHRKNIRTPERRLFYAILEAALQTLARGREDRQLDVLTWIDGGMATVTFERVCEVLDIEPSSLRTAIHRKRDENDGHLTGVPRRPPAHNGIGEIALPPPRQSRAGRRGGRITIFA